MATRSAAPPPLEVFQASIAVERSFLRQVVRAVLGTILFHRVCGNLRPDSLSVASVTFPVPAEPELEELIAAKVERLVRVLLDRPNAAGEGSARRAKLYVSLYPTPLPAPPPSTTPSYSARLRHHPTPATAGASRSASPAATVPSSAGSDVRAGLSPSRRAGAVTLAQAAPAAVSSALGWFSASARAALTGGGGAAADPATLAAAGAGSGDELRLGSHDEEGQEDELRVLDALEARAVRPWEGWCIEFEALGETPASRSRAPTAAEERLRTQLNDFVLRSLEFTMLKTSHVPPITTTDRMPYGVLILVDPAIPPFTVPKPVIREIEAFPALHKALVAGSTSRGGLAIGGERRAASPPGRRW